MLQKITVSCFKSMIKYGINNLESHCDTVNDLNVFPVPDGDTGTNMVMTLKNGLPALDADTDSLTKVAKSFANAVVFGARGNSGVIISQFFKGVSESIKGDVAPTDLLLAFETGCSYAYTAVAQPVEGTMLTVIKDGSAALRNNLENISTIDDAITVFLSGVKQSLENTPNLLPILKKAGVIDSGGAGFMYFVEGIENYLKGEPLEYVQPSTATGAPSVDYSSFNRYSTFEYGYCTETLLQLTGDENGFDYSSFSLELQKLGESIVTSFEQDKVKVHIHTHTPEKVLQFCHQFGEFLSLKIENMSVQHTQNIQKYLYTKNQEDACFALVAVAPNSALQKMLSEMGADVVILSAEAPSSQDFIEAFEHLSDKEILVFPNSSNSVLSAIQAGSLYGKARITVVNCHSIAQCYSAMATIDFCNPDIDEVIDIINEAIGNVYEIAITRSVKNVQFGAQSIVRNDYMALAGDDVLMTGEKFEDVVLETVRTVVENRECSVITMFYGQRITKQLAESIAETINSSYYDVEVCLISTQDIVYDLILSFE